MELFGQDIGLPMPEAFLSDHAVWDEFVGGVWASVLGQAAGLGRSGTVVEIGPGNAIKLGAALAAMGFQGDLYIVDRAPAVLAALRPRYAALLPKARLHWLDMTLEDALPHLPRNPDAVVANHLLDDMILNAASDNAHVLAWGKAYTDSPGPALKSLWQELLADDAGMQAANTAVVDTLQQMMAVLSPKNIVLNQYPSTTLGDHGLDRVNGHAIAVLDALKAAAAGQGLAPDAVVQAALNLHPHYNNRHIGRDLLNARYWMLCRTPSKNA